LTCAAFGNVCLACLSESFFVIALPVFDEIGINNIFHRRSFKTNL
jgi:hypothetical protein